MWYTHYLSHWGCQTNDRLKRWEKLVAKINDYCNKYYKCNWGEQKVNYDEEIPPYNPLIPIQSVKDIKTNMINRPLYIDKTLIGYIKGIKRVSIIVGYHSEWDEVDGDYYPNVPDYEHYNASVLLYGEPKKVSGLNFYTKDHKVFILGNSLDNYSVYEDKVILESRYK